MAIAHKPDHDVFKLPKNGFCCLSKHCRPNTQCRLNALLHMIKCRPNTAIAHNPDHDFENLPKNGLCRLNAFFAIQILDIIFAGCQTILCTINKTQILQRQVYQWVTIKIHALLYSIYYMI